MSRLNTISRRPARVLISVAALLALVSTVLPAAAQDATPEATESLLAGLGYPELIVTTDGADFDAPAEIAAGRYRVVLQNDGALPANLEFYRLPEGATIDDLLAAFESYAETGELPGFFYEVVSSGGPVAAPGERGEVVLDLTTDEWVVNLYTNDDDEETNQPKALTVTGEMPAIEDPPVAVEVGLVEMTFELPESIAAGPQIWKVVNNGQQPHHLVLWQIPEGSTEEQVIELVGSFFGPPTSPEAGATPAAPALSFEDVVDVLETPVFSSGQANWIELDLAPGAYVAICFLPDVATGAPHIMLGMLDVFTVGE